MRLLMHATALEAELEQQAATMEEVGWLWWRPAGKEASAKEELKARLQRGAQRAGEGAAHCT